MGKGKGAASGGQDKTPTRQHCVICTGYIPPYQKPIYLELAKHFGRLTILVSTEMEGERAWVADWGGLEVVKQRTWTRRGKKKHAGPFGEIGETHLPTDTLGQLRRLRPDVLVSEEFGARTLAACWHRWRNPTCKLIVAANLSEHTELYRGKLRRTIRRYMACRADLVTANGESGKRYLRQLGIDDAKIGYFPYAALPIEEPLLDASGRAESNPRCLNLLYCGQLVPRKGLVEFIHDLDIYLQKTASSKATNVHLTIAGDGPLREQLREIAAAANFPIKMLGETDHQDLIALMRHSSALVFPTLSDEWGLVVNEALGVGLPVIGSVYSQAVEELIRDGLNGWQFRPDDKDSVQRVLNEVFQLSTGQFQEMQTHCWESVRGRTGQWAAQQLIDSLLVIK